MEKTKYHRLPRWQVAWDPFRQFSCWPNMEGEAILIAEIDRAQTVVENTTWMLWHYARPTFFSFTSTNSQATRDHSKGRASS